MRVLGPIGGISWVSTRDYYIQINKGINAQLGNLNYAECMIYSFNYQKIKDNNDANDWNSTLKMVVIASKKLEKSGAKGIVLCANTIHFIADQIGKEINIPIIHIATSTALEIKRNGLRKIGLLGTKFTMEYDFFKSKLDEQGIEVLIPKSISNKEFIHDTIFSELGKGIIRTKTKEKYLSIIKELINDGAEGIIAGCTEIPLLIKESDI
ncbi:amino acid racemase [Flavobacteriaceae bacterium 3-367]|uniref:aspartate/glutamate racemase family protein n=1 Tax=Eudoraea algarum TaxID=3417568 RepID=UPI00327228B5